MADAASLQQFELIISGLMNQDNNVRNQAEQAFNAAKANPDALMSALISLLRNNQQEAVRVRSRCSGRPARLAAAFADAGRRRGRAASAHALSARC